jgi:hypothetical protein
MRKAILRDIAQKGLNPKKAWKTIGVNGTFRVQNEVQADAASAETAEQKQELPEQVVVAEEITTAAKQLVVEEITLDVPSTAALVGQLVVEEIKPDIVISVSEEVNDTTHVTTVKEDEVPHTVKRKGRPPKNQNVTL